MRAQARLLAGESEGAPRLAPDQAALEPASEADEEARAKPAVPATPSTSVSHARACVGALTADERRAAFREREELESSARDLRLQVDRLARGDVLLIVIGHQDPDRLVPLDVFAHDREHRIGVAVTGQRAFTVGSEEMRGGVGPVEVTDEQVGRGVERVDDLARWCRGRRRIPSRRDACRRVARRRAASAGRRCVAPITPTRC